MPFITEQLWHEIGTDTDKFERAATGNDFIIIAPWPKSKGLSNGMVKQAEIAFEIVSQVRNVRASKGLSPRESLRLFQKGSLNLDQFWPVVKKLANISEVSTTGEKPMGTSFLTGSTEFTVPLEGKIDVEKEKAEILKEIEYHKGFLVSVDKKLGNEKFVAGAKPEVVELERRKKADAESKIKTLQERLKSL